MYEIPGETLAIERTNDYLLEKVIYLSFEVNEYFGKLLLHLSRYDKQCHKSRNRGNDVINVTF